VDTLNAIWVFLKECCLNARTDPSCFAKGTTVSTPNGLKVIESLKKDDTVFSHNQNLNELEQVIVEKIAASRHSVINKITFSDGTVVKSTTDHPYWVSGKGWSAVDNSCTIENYGISVKELKVKDTCLILKNGSLEEVQIANIETIVGDFKMYDISGGENHCFFANGILVHDENLVDLQLKGANIEFATL